MQTAVIYARYSCDQQSEQSIEGQLRVCEDYAKSHDIIILDKENQSMAKTKYDNTKWSVPSKRAKGYAEERKVKVHKWGQKKGKQLTDYEAGMRSGYLQCQNDHAGMYKYTKALSEGKSKAEAKRLSRIKGKKKNKDGDAA